MAVKASITITISKYRDCDSITRYYKLQASTAAAPAIPTTLNPSGWSTAEPTYTSGSTNTLYYTDCYIFSDGTFQYTDDGNGKAVKSSSYEAAKEAYNKAQAAQDSINDLEIGGRNLLLNSKTLPGKTGTNIDNDGFSEGYTTGNGTWNEKQYWWSINATDNPLTGKQVCISLDFKTDDITKINKMAFSIGTYASNKSTRKGDYNLYVTNYKTIDGTNLENDKWKRIYCVATIPSNFTHSDARYYALQTKIAYDAGTPTMYYKKIKIELGNKPTDWSPAPEDTESNIETQINNIQIGGTNLCVGTKLMPTNTQTLKPYSMYFSYNNNINTIELEDNFRAVHITTNDSWKGITCKEFNRLKPKVNEEYIIQTMIKSSGYTGEIGFYAMIYDSNNTKKTGSYLYLEKPDGTHTNSYYIATILSLSDNINEKLWLKLKPTQLLIDLINAGGHVELSFQTHDLAKNSNDGYINFWKMKLEKGNKPTDWTPAPEDIENKVTSLQTQVDNIQIGGTNLLRGTNTVTSLGSSSAWSNGTWRNAGGGTGTRTSISVSNAPNANIKVGWSTTSTSGQVLISQDNVPMTNGEKYILSCYAKGTGSILLQYGNGTVGYTSSNAQITDENNWKKYSYTFTSKGTANIYLGSNSPGNDVSFCGIKLESGNKATDWSPAPEDIETELNAVQADYLKETTFTNYKSDQIKKDNTFEQRIKQTSVTIYGNDDGTIDPDAGEALVNRLNKVDNDLNGENGALDRIEAAEGTLEGTGLNEYDQAIKITQRFLNVETDVDQIKNMFKITGGTNLIQNSVGYFTDRTGKPTMWNIAANTIYTPFGYDGDLVGVTISRGKLFCAKGSMTTTQNNIMTLLANKKMSISFKYKNGANATSKVKIFNGSVTFFEKTFNSTVNSWTEVIATFDCTVNSLQITIESTNTTNNNGILISDLMLNYGDVKPWELCSNEVYGAMVKLSGLGIEVTATTAHTKNFMTTDGILVYEYDSEHDIVGNLITKITDDGILTNQLESTGDIIERNLVHTMIKDSANHNVYVEYIR